MSIDISSRMITVGLVASTDGWRSDLQAYLEHHVDHAEAFVIRDPHLLVDERLDLVIVDDAATVIGRAELDLLARRSIPVVGLYHDDGSGRGEQHLIDLGVARRLPVGTDVVELARLVRSYNPLPAAPSQANTSVGSPPGRPVPDPGSSHRDLRSPLEDRHVDQVLSPAWIVAIGGVSERRHELGALIASGYGRMHQSMVIDLDPYRPRLARRFRLQLQPNVLVACRAIDGEFEPMHFTGRRTVSAVELPFWSLVGLPSPEAVEQVRGPELRAVIDAMAAVWPRVVLVTDGATGDASALEIRAAALQRATTLTVAADPTPEGVLECLDWLVQTDAIDRDREVDVVFCGRPADRPRRLEIADQIREHRPDGAVRDIVFVPWDEKRIIAASWEGRHLARRSRTSRVASKYASLVADGTAKRLEIL